MNRLRTHIKIGSFELFDPVSVRVVSERGVPLVVATIVITEDSRKAWYQELKKDDPVTIRYGYLDVLAEEFEGVITGINPGREPGLLELTAIGDERALSTTIITQSFRDEAPEEIIRYCISQAGLSCGRIDSPGVVLPHFSGGSIPVWEVALRVQQTCTQSFNLSDLMDNWKMWAGRDGKVNWGDFSEEAGEDAIVIESGVNLIRHGECKRGTGWNVIESFLVPGLYASMDFRLEDVVNEVSGVFQAQRVEHVISEGKARSTINYRDMETDAE